MRTLSLISLVALALPMSAFATSYNATSSFSTTGSTGQFSYGYGTPGSGTVSPNTGTGTYTGGGVGSYSYVYGAAVSTDGTTPLVGNGSGQAGTVNVPPADLILHPGDGPAFASIVVFTAPTAGTYNVDGLFQRGDTSNGSGNGVFVSIYTDNSALLFSGFISPATYLTTLTFDQDVTLAAGETVDFEVAPNGAYSNDSTGLQAEITSVTPEPSSLVLLGTGILGLAGTLRRKLRK